MNILIADSGATKADWLYSTGTELIQVQTQGLHPATIQELQDGMDIRFQIGELKPDKIFFYGTGCGNPVSNEIIKRFLSPIFPEAQIQIQSDLDGSAKAFFGDDDGVVAVLGTGAICAKIEKGKVVKKSASLGYAIGDEGSAADIGRKLLRMFYRKNAELSTVTYICNKIENADYGDMMNRIYTSPKPNRELASIAGKVLQKGYPAELDQLIRDSFQEFIENQLSTLELSGQEKVIFTGKVAEVHQKILISVMAKHGFGKTEVRHPVIASWRERFKTGTVKF